MRKEGRLERDHNIGRGNNIEDEHQHNDITHKVKVDFLPFNGTYNPTFL